MRYVYQIIVMILVPFLYSFAQFKFVGNIIAHKEFPNRVEFVLDNAKLNVYIYDDNVIRFRYTNKEEFSRAPSYAVIYEIPPRTNFTLKETEELFIISTQELIIQISKSPCRVSVYDLSMNLINADDEAFGVSFDHDEVRCFKKLLTGEDFYGLGEKTGDLKKTGSEYTLWNTDYPGYDARTDELYQSIPFFYGIRNFKAYGIFFDNTYRSHFNFGASNNRFYWFGAEQGEMDYYFLYGPEMKRILSSYTTLTGRMELPPLWALGYQQSRWSYYPESTVRDIADNFRTRKIPCDVLYLDIHYTDGYRVFTWDENRFPNPQKMIDDLRLDGFKLVPIIDPGIKADSNYFAAKEGIAKNLFTKCPDGTLYQGEVWPSWAYFPDFTNKEARAWWGTKLSVLMKDGIEGFWNDMNEPSVWGQHFPDIVQFDDNGFKASHKKIHNVYGLEMAKATREALRKYSDKRHFILTRAGFSGIQRYSAVWTGDNVSNEEHLRLACTMALSMGISGVPFIGADVGGFIGDASKGLYLRWMELGAFTPFFRQHSAYDTKAKEPWTFGEDTEDAVRDIINLRYTMLPYLYNEFYMSTQTGLPMMRPMFMNFQNDKECYAKNAQYQFMLGENLLVAPVLSEKEELKRLYLPEGSWLELRTKEIYQGNQWITIETPREMIPLFLKEGGMVPMQDVQQYVGEKRIEQTELLMFPSATCSYSLYEDDGISYEYQTGKFSITSFSCEKKNNALEIAVKKEKNGYQSYRKYYLFRIVSTKEPRSISKRTKSIPAVESLEMLNARSDAFCFSTQEKILYIKTRDDDGFVMNVDF